ncbi:MAG TPA: hypothetical protein VGJ84_06060 [Polyangiaceae bacterium]|jgi:hypothetical protein
MKVKLVLAASAVTLGIGLLVGFGCSGEHTDVRKRMRVLGFDIEEPPPERRRCATTITGKHLGHILAITDEDVSQAKQARTFDIRGGANHSHTLTITLENFQELQQGKVLSFRSSTDSQHDHAISVDCTEIFGGGTDQ